MCALDADDNEENLRPPSEAEEIKNGQWMGVTVRSQRRAAGKVCELFPL